MQYKIIFFKKANGQKPVQKFLDKLSQKSRSKIITYIKSLSTYPEFRREPFSRHLVGKLRELKIDYSRNRYRIIYFFNIGKIIILLHAFAKKTSKTPRKEINKAKKYMQEYLNNI